MLKISPNWNAFRPIYVPQYFHYAKYFPIIIIKTLNQWLVFTQLQTIILLWPQSIFKELNSNIYDCSLAYYTFYYTGIFDAGPSTTVCDTQDRSIGMSSIWISDCFITASVYFIRISQSFCYLKSEKEGGAHTTYFWIHHWPPTFSLSYQIIFISHWVVMGKKTRSRIMMVLQWY